MRKSFDKREGIIVRDVSFSVLIVEAGLPLLRGSKIIHVGYDKKVSNNNIYRRLIWKLRCMY